MSSQMAVWTVERIFDIGAFAVLMAIDVFAFGHRLPFRGTLYKAAGGLLILVAALALFALLIRRNGSAVADWLDRRFSQVFPKIGNSVCHKIRAYGEGLNTIHDGSTFLKLAGVSLAIWFTIAIAYSFVLHAYPQHELRALHVPEVVLLMASSMVGSMIQLPAVGGGSQLAVISMLSSPEWFGVSRELAVSAGMMLWVVTFMMVVPVGLALAHREHISLRKISEESEHGGEQSAAALPLSGPS